MKEEELLENMKNKAGFFKHNNMQIVDLKKDLYKVKTLTKLLGIDKENKD